MDKRLYYINGQPVEVPQKVFDALVESDNKIRYFEHDLKVNRKVLRDGEVIQLPSREDSLDRLLELHIQFADKSADVAGGVERAMMADELHQCLTLLDADEQELIQALYFDGHTERSWSKATGIPRMTICNRKYRILAKIRKLMGF